MERRQSDWRPDAVTQAHEVNHRAGRVRGGWLTLGTAIWTAEGISSVRS